MTTLRLREYQTTDGVPLTPRQAEILRSRFKCEVTLADPSGLRYDVRPRQRVGALVDGDLTIVVRPKLEIGRVLFLLAHAAYGDWEDDASLAAEDSLTDGVVLLFTILCDRALRNGVLRGYLGRDDRLHTVRGRIDFTEQLRATPGRDLPLAVSYQDHDEDILENRLLRAALDSAARLPIHAERTRQSLTHVRRTLGGITPVRYDPRHLPTVQWTRLNQHYRPAVDLARLILACTEADLDVGAISAPGLIVDMDKVFEHFVRNATRQALGVTEREFPAGRPLPLDEARQVLIEPDLSLWIDGRCRFVGELKYRYDTGDGTTPNLYQTLAYATASGLPEATLVYADGPTSGTTHHLCNIDVRIHVRHLDLAAPPADLLRQVRSLADHIRPHATRVTGGRSHSGVLNSVST